MIEKAEKIKTLLNRRLLAWYGKRQRRLPWRETKDPYRIWISEIMLQQTQVDTVIPYYRRFLRRFPTIQSLAKASLQEVLKAWENMGYYSRAKNLHAAARIVVEKFDGKIPDTLEGIQSLPGIGAYTAGAVLSIAYGRSVAAVDGNVRRILCRIFAIRKPMDDPAGHKVLQTLVSRLIPGKHAGDFNQALMDLGATLCRPKSPACSVCPVAGCCLAYEKGLQDTLPARRKPKAIPERHAVAAVIRDRNHRILAVQRPVTGLLSSLWKFPGGLLSDREEVKSGLVRLTARELGISIRPGKTVATIEHAYTHFRVKLHAHECLWTSGAPGKIDCQDWKWVSKAEFGKLPLSKVDRMILERLTG